MIQQSESETARILNCSRIDTTRDGAISGAMALDLPARRVLGVRAGGLAGGVLRRVGLRGTRRVASD